MINIAIYSVTPAPYGDDYRYIESFNTIEDGIEVLKILNKVAINFEVYRLISWDNMKPELIYDSWRKE